MSDKLLTIVIPSYNMQDYLPKCLDSLIISPEQMELLEVLVINDGSKDKTSEIAHQYENKYPNVFRVIDKENGNYGSCVNRGLAEAKGEYIKILDADDYFNTNNFEKFVLYIKESCDNNENVDLFLSDFATINTNGDIINNITFHLINNTIFSIKELSNKDFTQKDLPYIWMHALTYRISILHKMNYTQIEGISYTDRQWISKPMLHVEKIKYFSCIIYHYMIGRTGQTIAIANNNIWMLIKCTEDFIKWYTDILLTDYSNCTDNILFLKNQLLLHIKGVYAQFLLSENSKEYNNQELKEFDSFLQGTNPHIYSICNTLQNDDKFHFRFIKKWRKHKSTKSVLFLLYTIYHHIILLRNELFHIH